MPYLNRPESDPLPMDCRILTAALELFVNQGYHNVSIHDVQKHADVSIGSIYKHFGGKEGIARELHERLLVEMNELVDSVLEMPLNSVQKCNKIIELLLGYTETRSNIIAFVLHAKHTEFLTDEKPICSAEPFQKIRGMIQQGMDMGEIKTTDCWVAASVIFGATFRMIHMRLDGMIDRPLPEFYEQIVDLTWNGLIAPEATNNERMAVNE